MYWQRIFKWVMVVAFLAVTWGGALNAEPIPVGYWALDDGQTNPNALTAVDASAGGNNGTLLNFDSPPSWVAGQVGGALQIDGSNDRVDMGDVAALDITGSLSMAFWMNRLGDGSRYYGPLVGKNKSGGYANDGYWVGSYDDATLNSIIRFSITDPSGVGTNLDSVSGIANDEWHHIAVVYDPAVRMAIYIDGELDAELTSEVPTAIQSVTSGFTLGNLSAGSSTDSYCYNGRLDEVLVYNQVLSAEEIGDLVPEPSSLLLIGMGLLGLIVRRRRTCC